MAKASWPQRRRPQEVLGRPQSTAAIANTNAFKVNEDVVIPLPRMGEYTLGIERINIELSLRNKLALADAPTGFIQGGNCPWAKVEDAEDLPSPEQLTER